MVHALGKFDLAKASYTVTVFKIHPALMLLQRKALSIDYGFGRQIHLDGYGRR